MKGFFLLMGLFMLHQTIIATPMTEDPEAHRGSIMMSSTSPSRVVALFREIAKLKAPRPDPQTATTCGYIFSGDPNKFGCRGSGRAASDVAAACQGGGQLACSGSGANRTCTCAFD